MSLWPCLLPMPSTVPLPLPPSLPRALDLIPVRDSRSCSANEAVHTVSYAFISRGALPLWPLWQEYFDGCGGRAVPIVHAQDISSHASLKARSHAYNGVVLSRELTLTGSPRFSWTMVAIMLRLYRGAASTIAPNGCTPRWVITLSEHCAPVQSCQAVHAGLAAQPGVNRIQPQFGEKYEKSQWTALWLEAAQAVAAEEQRLEQFWQPRIRNKGHTIDLPPTGERWPPSQSVILPPGMQPLSTAPYPPHSERWISTNADCLPHQACLLIASLIRRAMDIHRVSRRKEP